MDINRIQAILSNWGKDKPLIKRIYIFGSRARGDHKPDSDLDIAIELDNKEIPPDDESGGIATWMHEAKEWRKELSKLIPLEIQIEHHAGEETPTIAKGLRESSIKVYEKKSNN